MSAASAKASDNQSIAAPTSVNTAIQQGLAAARVGFATVSVDGESVNFDQNCRDLFGVRETERSADLLKRVGRVYRRPLRDFIAGAASNDSGPANLDFSFTNGGEPLWIRVAMPRMPKGLPQMLVVSDVTCDRIAYDCLAREAEHLRYTVEYNPQLPWIADGNAQVLDFTDRWLKMIGLTREEAMGDGWMITSHPDDRERVGSAIMAAFSSGQPFDVRLRVRLASGEYHWMQARGYPRRDARGRIVRWYGYTEDIHEHVLVEEKIRWTAEHDSLTGLPNRNLLNQALEKALGEGLQKLSRVGLLLMDLDQFKEVNDLLGHDAGDLLLKHFTQLLSSVVPSTALVARIGGDEFAVLLPVETGRDEILALSENIFAALKQPIRLNGRTIECRTSIGAAIYPDHGLSPTELFKHADIALYDAKARGRSRIMMFEEPMQRAMQRRVAMINLGRQAVETNSILPFYQPQFSMITGELTGFEALLRRRDRHGRICGPDTVAAAFEELEVADAIGRRMLDLVLEDMVRWRDMGLQYGPVAINASSAEFRNSGFAAHVIDRIAEADIPYNQIIIEVTEGVFLGRQAQTASDVIETLDRKGVGIALDDFGTGFASLSHLRQFPVHTLKIDRSFITGIVEVAEDAAIVAAVVNLGRSLGIKVVAEGIETVDQALALRLQGCEFGQGYFFKRPMPSADVPTLVRNWKSHGIWNPARDQEHSRQVANG